MVGSKVRTPFEVCHRKADKVVSGDGNGALQVWKRCEVLVEVRLQKHVGSDLLRWAWCRKCEACAVLANIRFVKLHMHVGSC